MRGITLRITHLMENIKNHMFKNRKEYTEWALDLLDKYGVKDPSTYSAAEIKHYNPNIPESFIDDYTGNTNNYDTYKVNIKR
jgi:hypothetical protein